MDASYQNVKILKMISAKGRLGLPKLGRPLETKFRPPKFAPTIPEENLKGFSSMFESVNNEQNETN